jgi:menaquinone-dependent protoporphyrinogen IX oxidase
LPDFGDGAWGIDMAAPKVIVSYFSRTGTTRAVAGAIAAALNADIEEISDGKDRRGPAGYLRTIVEAIRKRPVAIAPAKRDPAAYDLVVVGTPVWAWSPSALVRTYLAANASRLPQVAFFCVMGATGSERTFAQMRSLAGKSPRGTIAFTTREVVSAGYRARLDEFIRALLTTS